MALSLPYPDLEFVPLDVLTAEEMNEIVANYTYISNQFPLASINIGAGQITTDHLANNAVTMPKIDRASDVHSSDEAVVGTWVDGRTLYRRSVVVTTLTTQNSDFYSMSGWGVREVIFIGGVMFAQGRTFPIPQTDSSSTYAVVFQSGSSLRGRAAFTSAAPEKTYLVIYYTK